MSQFKKDKKFLISVSVVTALIFAFAMVQNILRYGMHDSYNPWTSILYLTVSVLLFLPLVPFIILIARKIIQYNFKLYWIYSAGVIVLVIATYFIVASTIFYTINYFPDWISEKFIRYYFGREVIYHTIVATGAVYYVRHQFGLESEKMISGTVGRKQITLKANLIEYIEADDHYLKLHAQDGSLLKRATMDKMSEELKPEFIRIHRKYLVNRNAIKAKEKHQRDEFVILNSGERLKIGRSYQPLEF
ncbi:MAG: LytTR family transcriptional regulator [bacterium]|nr:LytTR family transcriptional regulator [bacterium]